MTSVFTFILVCWTVKVLLFSNSPSENRKQNHLWMGLTLSQSQHVSWNPWALGRQYTFWLHLASQFLPWSLPLSEASFPILEKRLRNGTQKDASTHYLETTLLWRTWGPEKSHAGDFQPQAGKNRLDYKRLYKRSISGQHVCQRVSPWPYCMGRAHCPVTLNQLEWAHTWGQQGHSL